MKAVNTIVKILTALAAVAGAVYIVATYGERIVEWAKKILASLPKCPACEEAPVEEVVEEAIEAEEVVAEEAAEEPVVEEPVVEAPVVDEPVAEDHDFAE